MRNKIYAKNTECIAYSQNLSKNLHFHKTFVYLSVGGNLKKRLTTKNIQENEAISNCKIE